MSIVVNNKAKHTPGEWTIKHLPQHKMYAIYGSGKFLAKSYDVQSDYCDLTHEEAEANAKLIVSAVNNFSALVQNLTRIVDRIEENGLQINFPSAYSRAKELLNQIEKENTL